MNPKSQDILTTMAEEARKMGQLSLAERLEFVAEQVEKELREMEHATIARVLTQQEKAGE